MLLVNNFINKVKIKKMDRKELIKKVQDPKYIPGIYNYCDRWCERCQFTSRCLNHSIEEKQNCKLEEIDVAN